MTISQMPDGSVCHIELFARDLSEMMVFYSEMFGWDVRTALNGYGMWKDASGLEGGFSTTGRANDTGNTVYLKVDDLEGCLHSLRQRDIEIIQGKTLISPDYGYMALFRDPSGNIIGLWSKK